MFQTVSIAGVATMAISYHPVLFHPLLLRFTQMRQWRMVSIPLHMPIPLSVPVARVSTHWPMPVAHVPALLRMAVSITHMPAMPIPVACGLVTRATLVTTLVPVSAKGLW